MSKKKLFEEDSDEDIQLKIENEYAKKYDTWREKEEIHKLEQKYGPNALNSDASESSDSEDESDEPPEVSEEIEAQFLKTLSLLKTKDPRIYDTNYNFFNEEKKEIKDKEPKAKTLTFDDSDDDDEDGEIFKIEKKAELNDAEKNPDGDIDKDTKTSKKGEKIKEYLTGKAEQIDVEVERDLAPLKALWSDPKLNEGEAFLRDYILNKRYLEDDCDTTKASAENLDSTELEADERTVEEQAKFERAYNFRFEEPDEEYLKRYPRTMNYIRPKDDRRSRKRAEVRARKEEEKKRKMEEIARLKALKLKEIQEKIAKIKEVTGNQDLAFEEQDIEGDFDPAEHDRRMRALFDAQFYGGCEDTKPVFPDLDEELEIENWDKYEATKDDNDPEQDVGEHCEDEGFNMDADFDPQTPRAGLMAEIQKTLGKRRRPRKRRSQLAQLLSRRRPTFVPEAQGSTYAQHMEEYYRMDCEDVIGGDLPTRFKYREVEANDYGLTVEEILMAEDRQLSAWAPLKRLVRLKPAAAELSEKALYRRRAQDEQLKRRMLPSLFRDLPEEPEVVVPIEESSKKKKKKKKKKEEKVTVDVAESGVEVNSEVRPEQISDETADDQPPVVLKKKKRKQKKGEDGTEVNSSVESNSEVHIETVTSQDVTPKEKRKKKKKHKSDSFIVTDGLTETPSREESLSNNTSVSRDNETTEVKVGSKRKLSITDNNEGPVKKKTNLVQTLPKHKEHNNKKHFNKKIKQKNKQKNKQNNDKSNGNPLNKLSDERLKAYGLNPKKYRGFLKYKKF